MKKFQKNKTENEWIEIPAGNKKKHGKRFQRERGLGGTLPMAENDVDVIELKSFQ